MDTVLLLTGKEALSTFKVGHILRASVVAGTPTDAGGGRALLELAGQQIEVRSQSPLLKGDKLQVQITDIQPENIKLQIIRPEQALTATRQVLLQQARHFLPKQDTTAIALAAAKVLENNSELPPAIKQTLSLLSGSSLKEENLADPARVKQAILASGIFLEPALANKPDAILKQDIKAQLFRLAEQLRTLLPPEPKSQANHLRDFIRPAPTQSPPPQNPVSSGQQTQASPTLNQQNIPGQKPLPNPPGKPLLEKPLPMPGREPADKPVINRETITKPLQMPITNKEGKPVQEQARPQTDPRLPQTFARNQGGEKSLPAPAETRQQELPRPPIGRLTPVFHKAVQLENVQNLPREEALRFLSAASDAALSRIHLSQIGNAERLMDGQHNLDLEFAITSGNNVQMTQLILEELKADGSGKARQEGGDEWHICLSLDLPGLGPLKIDLYMNSENGLKLAASSELEHTRQLFTQNMPMLEQRLASQGLNLVEFVCNAGMNPAEQAGKGIQHPHLLDLKA